MDNGKLHNGKRILKQLTNVTLKETNSCQQMPTMDPRLLIVMGPCGGSHADNYTYYSYYFFIPDEIDFSREDIEDCAETFDINKCPLLETTKPFAYAMARNAEALTAITEHYEYDLHFGGVFEWRPDSD